MLCLENCCFLSVYRFGVLYLPLLCEFLILLLSFVHLHRNLSYKVLNIADTNGPASRWFAGSTGHGRYRKSVSLTEKNKVSYCFPWFQ